LGALVVLWHVAHSSSDGLQLVLGAMQQLARDAGHMQQLQEVEATGHAAWVATAQARQELLMKEQQLQAQEVELATQQLQLQQEREALAAERRQLQQDRAAWQDGGLQQQGGVHEQDKRQKR
jgi:hypothetical protein